MNSNRAAFILTHDDPGGARNLWEQVALALANRGWKTPLLSIYQKDFSGLSKWQPGTKNSLTVWSLITAVINLAKELKVQKPNVTLSAQPAANVVSALAGVVAGVKTRIISHHTPLSTYGRFQRILDLIVGCTPAVSCVVCVSEGVRLSLNNYPSSYRRKVVVIRNALAPGVASLISTLRQNRPAAIGKSRLKIVAAGRLAEQKNYPQLIEAMQHVNGADLFILGDGPDRIKLQQMIDRLNLSSKVHLRGHMSHEDALCFMSKCDVFAQPSLFEGHSVALLEAAALGLPLVVSDVPTQVEAVRVAEHRLCAAVVPIGDVAQLSYVLNRLVTDSSYMDALRDGSTEIAATSGFDRLVTAYEGIFTSSNTSDAQ